MFDVFVSVQDAMTGELYVSSVSTDNLSRCLSDCMTQYRDALFIHASPFTFQCVPVEHESV